MISAVIIDDERHAIREIAFHLKRYPEISVLASFINPLEALEKLPELKPQLVFLDIQMPQLMGIDVGSRILDMDSNMEIVFVTAYDQYAMEAFELNAIAYILKPIAQEKFENTMRRVIKRIQKAPPVSSGKQLKVQCFGNFQIAWDHEAPLGWRSEKTKEVFAYLLMHDGNVVARDQIVEAVFPDIEMEKAVKQLHNAIYYIRKSLQEYGVEKNLIKVHEKYCMSLGEVNFDKQEWRSLLQLHETDLRMDRIEEIYKGDYLEGADWPWAEIDRENYANDYVELLNRYANHLVGKGSYEMAEKCFCKAYQKNPFVEYTSLNLLQLYHETHQKSKAMLHFGKFEQLLQDELNLRPPKEILDVMGIKR
ncbi:MAG: response regulator [Deltaproteobacteria bacterium]|nr:response regulator [Deltaproteobacteria bacterium]